MFDALPNIKSENRVPPQVREARLARLREFYNTPRLGDPTPFGPTGLSLTPRQGEELGPRYNDPDAEPPKGGVLDEAPSLEGYFEVVEIEYLTPSDEGWEADMLRI